MRHIYAKAENFKRGSRDGGDFSLTRVHFDNPRPIDTLHVQIRCAVDEPLHCVNHITDLIRERFREFSRLFQHRIKRYQQYFFRLA